MAHHTLVAGAPNVLLGPGLQLRLEAINPTTDADVAGVTVAQWSIYGDKRRMDEALDDPLPDWTPEENV